jgi:hypothetical protein
VRLYSALEKVAKAELATLGINNSEAQPDQIPEPLRDEYVRCFSDPNTAALQFGFDASYRLLAALGARVGERYQVRERELDKLLRERNNSLLVHGWKPIRETVFDDMLAIALDFLGIPEDELPHLPVLPSV